ncbi:MAG: hypothetical protein JWP52_2914, partial [Rhizobacter sp.]|nr:hypothetical protein [Rhizobacter sp.]
STLDGTAEGALNNDYRTDWPYSQGSMPSRHAPGGARQDAGLSARSTLRGPVSGQALNPASFGSPSSRPMPSRFSGNASVLGAQPARAEDAALDAMARHVGQDAHLMALIRRLTEMASRPGELDVGPHSSTGRATGIPSTATPLGNTRTPFGTTTGASTGGAEPSDAPLAGLMAVNLIRAHRDELRQASPGALDHMVIDVVGSLFDQILSDPKVPPQMARQIARLQLPVLRVALSDVGFFSSRRHPVRRFVNRIASLACAFDDFEDGPGRTFLAEVSALVRDIVDGDFDQMAVYEAKLASLEAFIDQQNEQAVEAHGNAASMLGAKEVELRLQQRYTQQLTSALAEVATPEFIREFLAQVWSQAMMTAARQGGGADAALAQRYRQAARNLVTSVQPKGTPSLRKAFLLQLPPLMKDLNAGLDLIGWPAVARKEFFGKLLPLHAESLKGTPPTELQQNLLNKQLESILGVPVPRSEELSRSDTLPVLTDEVVEQKFSKEEVAQLGLVEERSVDWDGLVDIDLGAELEASESTPVDLELDIGTATSPAELPEPSQGPQLMAHVKLGFAYRMHLKGTWTKVRLSYVSPGRAFFVFTHGKKHQETLSMTARMLARMCDTGRLRAFENAYLIERATVRARKQLAALAPAGKH